MNTALLGKIFHWLQRLFKVEERLATPEPPTFHLQIRGADQRIPITLKPKQQLALGRANLADTPEPFVDLSPYNAVERGVQRKHAAILSSGQALTLIDLGSVNGTYLNGHRLVPHEARLLQDGDEIRLGRLRVYYLEEHKPSTPIQPGWIRLYSESRHDMSWWANERAWDDVLDLATLYGWQPALGDLRAYQRDRVVSTKDAQGLANALENALPDLADEIEGGFFGPRPVHEHWQVGKLKVRDLIVFCRLGGFRIVRSMPETEKLRD